MMIHRSNERYQVGLVRILHHCSSSVYGIHIPARIQQITSFLTATAFIFLFPVIFILKLGTTFTHSQPRKIRAFSAISCVCLAWVRDTLLAEFVWTFFWLSGLHPQCSSSRRNFPLPSIRSNITRILKHPPYQKLMKLRNKTSFASNSYWKDQASRIEKNVLFRNIAEIFTDLDSSCDCLNLELDLCLPRQAVRQWEPQRKLTVQYKKWASSFTSGHSLGYQGRNSFVLFLTWLTQMVRHLRWPVSSNLLLIFIFLTWKRSAPYELKCREGL